MNTVRAPENRHQSRSACDVSSGPLSDAQEPGSAPAGGDQRLELGDGLVGADRAAGVHDQRLAGVLVEDVDQPQRPAVGRLVGLEVQRPHVIDRRGGDLAPGRSIAGGRALARPDRHAQALL
ncbi:MAG: hypothetical protein ACRDK0_03915, partial [Solirubrobacteraceae bacterium]